MAMLSIPTVSSATTPQASTVPSSPDNRAHWFDLNILEPKPWPTKWIPGLGIPLEELRIPGYGPLVRSSPSAPAPAPSSEPLSSFWAQQARQGAEFTERGRHAAAQDAKHEEWVQGERAYQARLERRRKEMDARWAGRKLMPGEKKGWEAEARALGLDDAAERERIAAEQMAFRRTPGAPARVGEDGPATSSSSSFPGWSSWGKWQANGRASNNVDAPAADDWHTCRMCESTGRWMVQRARGGVVCVRCAVERDKPKMGW